MLRRIIDNLYQNKFKVAAESYLPNPPWKNYVIHG